MRLFMSFQEASFEDCCTEVLHAVGNTQITSSVSSQTPALQHYTSCFPTRIYEPGRQISNLYKIHTHIKEQMPKQFTHCCCNNPGSTILLFPCPVLQVAESDLFLQRSRCSARKEILVSPLETKPAPHHHCHNLSGNSLDARFIWLGAEEEV